MAANRSYIVPIQDGAQVGDIIVVGVYGISAVGTAPAGWTLLANLQPHCALYSHTVAAGEPGTVIDFTLGSNNKVACFVLNIRGASNVAAQLTDSPGAHTSLNFTVSNSPAPLIIVGCFSAFSQNFTQIFPDVSGTTNASGIGTHCPSVIFGATAANSALTFTASKPTALVGFELDISGTSPSIYCYLVTTEGDVPASSPAFLQHTTANSTTGVASLTAGSLTLATGENCIVVNGTWAGSSVLTGTVSDNNSGSWTEMTGAPALAKANDNSYFDLWYSVNHPSGATAVKTTYSGTTTWAGFDVSTYSGIATTSPVDQHNTSASQVATTINTGTITTTNASDLLVGGIIENSTGTITSLTDYGTSGGTVTLLGNIAPSYGLAAGYQIVSATGNYGFQQTFSLAAGAGGIIALKAVAAVVPPGGGFDFWSLGGATRQSDDSRRSISAARHAAMEQPFGRPPAIPPTRQTWAEDSAAAAQQAERERISRQAAAVELYYEYLQRIPPPNLTAHQWEWWLDIASAAQTSVAAWQQTQVALINYIYQYLQHMPEPGMPAHWFNWWISNAQTQQEANQRATYVALFNALYQPSQVAQPLNLTAHQWQFWNDFTTSSRYQETERQSRLALATNLYLNYASSVPPTLTASIWQTWQETAGVRIAAESQWALANKFASNLQYQGSPPTSQPPSPNWQFWTTQQQQTWTASRFISDSTAPPNLTAHQWQFWIDQTGANREQEINHTARLAQAALLYLNYSPNLPPIFTAHQWQFWNDLTASSRYQETERQNHLALAASLYLNYGSSAPPTLTATIWQVWQETADARNVAESQWALANKFASYLQHQGAPPTNQPPLPDWDFWSQNLALARAQEDQRRTVIASLLNEPAQNTPPPVAPTHDNLRPFTFWELSYRSDWRPLLLNSSNVPLQPPTIPVWQFWITQQQQTWTTNRFVSDSTTPPNLTAHQWQSWNDIAASSRYQETERQNRLALAASLYFNHTPSVPPTLTAGIWQLWREITSIRNAAESQWALANKLASNLLYQGSPPTNQPNPPNWDFWNLGQTLARPQEDRQRAVIANLLYELALSTLPPNLTAHQWQFWNDLPASARYQEIERQSRLARAVSSLLNYTSILPLGTTAQGISIASAKINGVLNAQARQKATCTGTATISGTLRAFAQQQSQTVGIATVNGKLNASARQQGSIPASTIVVGRFGAIARTQGQAAGTANVSGKLAARGSQSGQIAGVATTNAAIRAWAQVKATCLATANAKAIPGPAQTCGTIIAAANVNGRLTATGRAKFNGTGTAALIGWSLGSSSKGVSHATATTNIRLSAAGRSTGSMAGTAAATGRLTDCACFRAIGSGVATGTGRIAATSKGVLQTIGAVLPVGRFTVTASSKTQTTGIAVSSSHLQSLTARQFVTAGTTHAASVLRANASMRATASGSAGNTTGQLRVTSRTTGTSNGQTSVQIAGTHRGASLVIAIGVARAAALLIDAHLRPRRASSTGQARTAALSALPFTPSTIPRIEFRATLDPVRRIDLRHWKIIAGRSYEAA